MSASSTAWAGTISLLTNSVSLRGFVPASEEFVSASEEFVSASDMAR